MIEIKEDMKIFDGVDNAEFEKEYQIKDIDEPVRKQILQDRELRKRIVDLADIWDGKESERYGKQLLKILNDLGIKDIPEFYSKI